MHICIGGHVLLLKILKRGPKRGSVEMCIRVRQLARWCEDNARVGASQGFSLGNNKFVVAKR